MSQFFGQKKKKANIYVSMIVGLLGVSSGGLALERLLGKAPELPEGVTEEAAKYYSMGYNIGLVLALIVFAACCFYFYKYYLE